MLSFGLTSCGGGDKTNEDTKDDEAKTEEVADSPYKIDLKGGTTVTPGAEMYITFEADEKWSKNAWIGIVPSNVAHGKESENDAYDVAYQYLEGKKKGVIVLTAPTQPGKYDLRMNDSDDATSGKEVLSVSFEVK